jgi:hypothetical protein
MRRLDRNRRCRSQLAWAVLSFAAVQAGLGLGVERLWPAVRDPEFADLADRLRRRRADAPAAPLVVALGSSRMQAGLDAGRLSGARALVFNFGVPGGGAMMQGVCLRRLLGAGVRPDLVVVEVLPPGVVARADRAMEERQLDPARLTGAEVARLLRYYERPLLAWPRWAVARALPCHRHQAELRAGLGLDGPDDPGRQGVDGHGWRAFRLPMSEEDRARRLAFARGQYGAALRGGRLSAGMERAYHDLLRLCRREGMPAALVVMPEAAPFRALYAPEVRAGTDAFARRLAAEWQVPLLDARERVDDGGFWDGHHLTADGAAAFTAIFESEVLRPLLRGRLARARGE